MLRLRVAKLEGHEIDIYIEAPSKAVGLEPALSLSLQLLPPVHLSDICD